jgi:hypothetical protein
MIKKLSILAIVLFYAFSVVGVPITQHFCGGEPVPKSCSCAKSAKKSSCCSDKSIHAKIKADQKTADFKLDLKKSSVPSLPLFYYSYSTLSTTICSTFTGTVNGTNSPPLVKQKVGIYLYNCVFRI